MTEPEHISGVLARVLVRTAENQQLRARLGELNSLPLTPEREAERAQIVRRLGGVVPL